MNINDTIKSDIKINLNQDSSNQVNPTISLNDSGIMIVAWEDNREGTNDVYAQLLNINGSQIGNNIKINEQSEAYCPRVIINNNAIIITWVNKLNNPDEIFYQILSLDGQLIGTNSSINNNPNFLNQNFPGILPCFLDTDNCPDHIHRRSDRYTR